MRESELLSHILHRSADLHGSGAIVVGPGDDCAVLAPGGNARLLLTIDQLVESRHYAPGTPIDLIARKAVARSVSDIAAMGGTPRAGLATACLPPGFDRANELFDRMAHWARRYGAPLAGGDIAAFSPERPGPLVLTVTIVGAPHAARGPVLRSEARPGDSVYITGRAGNSFASGRHLSFEPRLAEGAWLCEALGDRLGAMIDVSDGVGRDAGRLAAMSAAAIELDEAAIPLHADVRDPRAALSDGEDYELLFTARGDVPNACPATGTPITRIGRVTGGAGCTILLRDGSRADASTLGWDHAA